MTDWTLGGIRVFMQGLTEDEDQLIARLNPLGGGTTLHFFGYDDKITKIEVKVVGPTDREAIDEFTRDGNTARVLTGPLGSFGSFFVKHVTGKLANNVICQTLRPDLPENSPVWDLSIELYRDE